MLIKICAKLRTFQDYITKKPVISTSLTNKRSENDRKQVFNQKLLLLNRFYGTAHTILYKICAGKALRRTPRG